MILTLTTTHQPATDLGFLLHKNPDRLHQMDVGFGTAHLFFPDAKTELATFAMVLDIDAVDLVRGRGEKDQGLLQSYVNDRPYAVSSFLSVAIAKTLRNALQGASKERQGLADQAIPLEAQVMPLPVRGDDGTLHRLFGPLGYEIETETIPLDEQLIELGDAWAQGPYVKLTLRATCRLRDMLAHLYVLIPVLDRQKHYYVDRQEIDKLIAKGEGWLKDHPERSFIAHRYLRQKRSWAREVLARIDDDGSVVGAEVEVVPRGQVDATDGIAAGGNSAIAVSPAATGSMSDDGVADLKTDAAELALEQPIRLHDQRLDTVAETLLALGARRVLDLGCGSGKLMKRLMPERQFKDIVGVDVSSVSLERAERRLRLDRVPDKDKGRVRVLLGALTYRDRRIEGFDAAALVEVIEHLDAERLNSMERAVFEFAKPWHVIVTTPNREYNAKFEGLEEGALRHPDHRFEWTRDEFAAWCARVSERFNYQVAISGIGEEDPRFGAPSQMAVFTTVRKLSAESLVTDGGRS
ncbi:MAG: 3' terminal RNA ribose 2'-O-methyltransferase Hen1 [Pseudomonadota bacterium]